MSLEKQGWIEWSGGKNPVGAVKVDVRQANGVEAMACWAHRLDWTHYSHWGAGGKIVAYRPTGWDERSSGTGKYQPLAWQVITDAKGFEAIHETNEDGGPGDLVAHVFSDHASLISAAPDLFLAIQKLVEAVAWQHANREVEEALAAIQKACK